MFRSLGSRNYRVWFLSGVISHVGSWVQSTAINWYILRTLTDGDATAVGIALALQFAPQLLLLPLTGWLPDRFDRRRLLLVIQSLTLALVLCMGILVVVEAMTLQLIFILSAAFGVLTACDIPARQTFVTDLVAPNDVSNAIALNSASFNLGRLTGPATAGVLLLLVGAGWAFIANAVSYLAPILALMSMRTAEFSPRATWHSPPSIWGGVRYLRKRADLIFVSASMFVIGALTINIPLTSSIVVTAFDGDAAVFGLVNSTVALGSLTGALVAARNARPRLGVLVIAVSIMTVGASAATAAPNLIWYTAALTVVGFAVILTLATANGYVQSTTPPIVRGRVIAAYMAVVMGSSTVGSPLLGAIADTAGFRWMLGTGAVAAALVTLAGVVWLRWGPVFDN